MENVIYTYLLIKTYFDLAGEDKDYINIFIPLVLEVIDSNQRDVNELQKRILDLFGLKIPIHTLSTLFRRARNDGLIDPSYQNGIELFKISQKGKSYQHNRESENEVSRKINGFLQDCINYLLQRGINVNTDQVMGHLIRLIQNNIQYFSQFSLDSCSQTAHVNIDLPLDSEIIDMCEYFEKNDDKNYKVLKDIILGSIISLALFQNDISKIEMKKYPKIIVFLDSNFLFRLQGLHGDSLQKPAQELVELLNCNNFELRVFDFTLDEMGRVVGEYLMVKDRFSSDIPVNTIYWHMKKAGWERSDVINYRKNLEKKFCPNIGIKPEKTKIYLNNFVKEDFPNFYELSEIKRWKGKRTIFHDLLIIKLINEKRGEKVFGYEDAGYIFLTSDRKLVKFNIEKYGHYEQNTLSEAVFENSLTNYLWLKNPSIGNEIPIHLLLHTYSQDLMIDYEIWESFLWRLANLSENNEISETDVNALLNSSTLTELLVETSEEELTEEFIISAAKKAETQQVKERNKLLDAIEEIKSDKKSNEEKAKYIYEEQRKKIIRDARKRTLSILIGSDIIILVVFIFFMCFYWDVLNPIIEAVAFVAMVVLNLIGFLIKMIRINDDEDEKRALFIWVYHQLMNYYIKVLSNKRGLEQLKDLCKES